MVLTEKVFIKVVNWGFCLLPLLSIRHLKKCDNSSQFASNESSCKLYRLLTALSPLLFMFMASLACMIYNITFFRSLSNALASFVQFILNTYTILRRYVVSISVRNDMNRNIIIPTNQQMMSQVDSAGITSNQAIGVELSPKTVASDTLIFEIDNPELDINTHPKNLKFKAPVLAALLAITPVPSNALPIPEAASSITSVDIRLFSQLQSFGSVISIINFLLLTSGKILQLGQLLANQKSKPAQPFQIFALDAICMVMFMLFEGGILSFHHAWQFALLSSLDIALLIISMILMKGTHGGKRTTLAGELRAVLNDHSISQDTKSHHQLGEISHSYGSIDYSA